MELIFLPTDLKPLAVGASNSIVVYCLTQRGRLDSKGDDNWTILQFTEHSLQTGAALGAGPVGKHKLDGKVTDQSYIKALPMSISKLLFVVTVFEGKAGKESPFLHGYVLEAVSLRTTSRQVFRVPLESEKAVAALDDTGRVFVLDAGKVMALSTQNWKEVDKFDWAHNDHPVVALAAFDDCLYTLDTNMHISAFHLSDSSITQHQICYKSDMTLVLIDSTSTNVIVQSEDSVFVLNNDQLWEVELDSSKFYGHCHATQDVNSNLALSYAVAVSYDKTLLLLADSIMSAEGSQILKVPVEFVRNVKKGN